MHHKKSKTVRSVTVLFWVICGFAMISYLTIAMLVLQKFDLYGCNLPWAISAAKEGFFSVYNNTSVDYPPVYLMLLGCFGVPLNYFASVDFWQGIMLLLKFWPVFFHIASAVVIFYLLSGESLTVAFSGGLLWLFNPAVVVNSVWWGQADSLLCLAIFLTFWCFYRRRPEAAMIFFALGCLTKLQMCYFAPVVLCELFFYYSFKKGFISLLLGVGTGLLGWLPFMISMKSVLLPFNIYFGGFSKYPYTDLNAANLYGLWTGSYTPDSISAIGNITFSQLSFAVLVTAVLAVVVWYIFSKRKNIRIESAVIAMFYGNIIFMFTTAQHERYQIPVMLLAFLWYLIAPKTSTLVLYILLTLISFLNQSVVLLFENYGGIFETVLQKSTPVLSVFNLLLFGFMTISVIREFLSKKRKTLS